MRTWRERKAIFFRSLTGVIALSALGGLAVLFAASDNARPRRESEFLLDDGNSQLTKRPVAPRSPMRAAEPKQRPGIEVEAVRRALEGAGIQDEPTSTAVARAMARVRQRGTPANEIFALITLTDRKTGERRFMTRGAPSPDLARFIREPRTAPEGLVYEESEEATANDEVEIVVRSVNVHARARSNGELSEGQERERKLQERNQGGGLSHRIEQGIRQRVVRGEINLDSEQAVPVMIEMRDIPRLRLPKAKDLSTGGLLWVGLDVARAREQAIIHRKQQVRELQRDLVQAVEVAGGRVRYASWTSGAIEAEVLASAIRALAARRDVYSIEFVEPAVEASHRYQGNDYYVATDAQDFDPWHTGVHGVSSKHPYTSRIVLALGEACIDQTNPAWRTGAPGSFTRGWFYDCDPGGVCTQGGVEGCSGSNSHGTRVAQLMAGDFMDGQDAFVSFANRRIMTGTCEECRFFFLQDQGLNQRTKVHDAACDLGVDIWESSIGHGFSCDGNGFMDGTVQSMINCDVLYVQAAANEGSGGGCTTRYPADHPWTFTVGGMFSQNPCNTSGAYYTGLCPYDANASRGGGTYDGVGTASIIDQTGPYRYSNLISPLTRNPVSYGGGNGTSFATPLVTGLMARMMDWYRQHISTSIFYDNRMRNFMLLFGDRSVFAAGTSRALNFHDTRWGSGRVGLVPFDSLPVWSIRRSSRTLSRGGTWNLTASVSPAATFYKAVVWHNSRDYSNEPMIRLTLNPNGCANPTLSVNRLDSKAMLVYTNLSGCTSVSITVRNLGVGFSGSRRFHFASYSTNQSERNF
ncbi:MAG: S8 family serine peptidase [Acidobacteriota bacterium]